MIKISPNSNFPPLTARRLFGGCLYVVLICCSLGLSGAVRCSGQTDRESLLYPDRIAKADAPPEEMIYIPKKLDDAGFNRIVTKVTRPTLMVYRPEPPRDTGVAMVVCPGGGYASLVIDQEGYAIARYFQQRGLTVAVLKYRLPDPARGGAGLPLSQQDALAAVEFMRGHATEWHLNPRRIGILGCSAGGHLAGSVAVLGEAEQGSRPDFVVLLYPVVFMDGPWAHAGSRRNLLGSSPSPARLVEFSLEQRARPGLPPFFITHAKDDTRVPVENSIHLAQALQKAGVSVELHLVEKGGHGFGLGLDPESKLWPEQFMAWLEHLAL